ncbi:hypothetical protein F5Y19DRAFT_52108 [Xylariaceae sp. FL1651]|nr:hypothetical protein F5Y19DRAFT_52108 [Xylariaceae sp. FL1651]
MSFGPPILMSGAFHFDVANGGGAGTSLSGVHPGIFRPPVSPSISSSIYLGRSTASLQSDASTPIPNVKRKRFSARESTPSSDWAMTTDTAFTTDSVIDDRSDFDPRPNGQERRYILAGQVDAPNGATLKQLEHIEDSIYSDVDYRRALGSKRPHDDIDSPPSRPMMVDLGPPVSTGWSSFAINAIGGVVGKVWEFCKAGPFRGFYAGEGRGYEISRVPQRPLPPNREAWCNVHDVTLPEQNFDPPPGGFPQSDYSPFHYERETPESTPPPAAKRRQISYGTPNDELRRNWVMIEEPANASRQLSHASRASSRHPTQRSMAPSLARRISKPVSRLNTPNFNRHRPSKPSLASAGLVSDREPASFASPRSPLTSPVMKAHNPSRIPVPSRPQTLGTFSTAQLTQQPSRIPSPSPYAKRGHRRSQSAVSPASVTHGKMKKRESLHEVQDSTPRLDATARSLAVRRMKEEMETDVRINDFNARLRDMIRQGKEALGTTIEVDLDDEGDVGMDPWESE